MAKELPPRACVECGEFFTPRRIDKIFCGKKFANRRECREYYRRNKQRLKEQRIAREARHG